MRGVAPQMRWSSSPSIVRRRSRGSLPRLHLSPGRSVDPSETSTKAEPISKVPVQSEKSSSRLPQQWEPFERFRREMDRLFEDFSGGLFGRSSFEPMRRTEAAFRTMPAVDVAETDKAYEIKAELPGLDEKNIEVKVANGVLSIKGEKQEEREEKDKDYYRRERSFGSFERSFRLPDDIEQDKIDATFKNGVLSVVLPKSAEAQKQAKKIEIKAG
jgi:HSP20 family protein